MTMRPRKLTVLLLSVSSLAIASVDPLRAQTVQPAPSSQFTPTEQSERHPVAALAPVPPATPSPAAKDKPAGAAGGTLPGKPDPASNSENDGKESQRAVPAPSAAGDGADGKPAAPSVASETKGDGKATAPAGQPVAPASSPDGSRQGAANDNAPQVGKSAPDDHADTNATRQAQGRPQQYTVASEAAVGMRLRNVPQDLRSPSIALDGLFAAIGGAHIFPDFKTAADATPDAAPTTLVQEWRAAQKQPNFDLKAFVNAHFTPSPVAEVSYKHNANENIFDYIDGMWGVLTRGPDKPVAYSSRLPLPYLYVVPGGRFSELYYWDSYFTMIGLYESGRFDLMRDMVKDMASQLDRYAHIPNGTRTYYLSRSEPPFFALMVDLLANHDGQGVYTTFLPELQREYDYWMDGAGNLAPGHAYRHVVRLADGTLLNRHWDDLDTPRDESYPEDVATANSARRPPEEVYRDLRAGGETGWDFSSRWLSDGHDMASIHTTDIATIEVNCLVAHLEQTLAHAYALSGDNKRSGEYDHLAAARIDAVRRLMWSADRQAFFDYDWKAQRQTTVLSAATVVPLFLHMATQAQADGVAATVQGTLLKAGGIMATDRHSGQQWDAPNGWAPLEWMAIKGFKTYGNDRLAEDIAQRWMTRVIATYEKSGVLLEKYDVEATTISPTGGGGGGEYPMQIGFGWTNGTLLGLMNGYPAVADRILKRNPLANQPTVQALPPVDAYSVSNPANNGEQKGKTVSDPATPPSVEHH
ncbi:hypothetical protein NCH01_01270 [Neoasaia chiangmaiensis]|uniref:Uncharacterized protein n=1 Tax=Neoasaia chiangmaiensis TaxID=320497 RepID=A0A1U9KSN7_9PROT|nr:alpha,alpha-trehalase TreF [Neoasaia chiangmaiensis]AQS88737.1 hypothetical protein A0U93_13330 [Neoasaia chiangmaiensis]GEN13696.1 hypothetical protein NCH01_01270 [Neoasaia chiangmaiensis]